MPIKGPNSTVRRPHERRLGALARLPKESTNMDDARKKSLGIERATLTDRIAQGTGYKTTSRKKHVRKFNVEDEHVH